MGPNFREPITSQEALSFIQKAVAAGAKEVNFQGEVFVDFDLGRTDIPLSLNCERATFRGIFNLCDSNFKGSFINLEGATLQSGIVLNGLKSLNGYSVYLRNATISGRMEMKDTKLNWLSIGGAEYRNEKGPINPIIRLDGSNIKMGLSLSEHN